MKTAVITVVHGREAHLRNQLRGLHGSGQAPDRHVIVAVEDPTVSDTVADCGALATVVPCRASFGELPLAHARNLGARTAIEEGAELLVFLDVDCIPGAGLIGRYCEVAAWREHRDAVLCGPVTYLPPCGPDGYDLAGLDCQRDPHPARPAPPDGTVIASTNYELFWSLSFAVSAPTWRRLGGFWPGYRGYGAEDTDFGQHAAALGIPLRWVGGAHAFHQHHPVSDPPVEHLVDIVRNATLFHQRWGWWPMTGWLDQFEKLALIDRDERGSPHLTVDRPTDLRRSSASTDASSVSAANRPSDATITCCYPARSRIVASLADRPQEYRKGSLMQETHRGVGPLPVDDDIAKARNFHLAQGILVGLRRCAPEVVMSELIEAAQKFGVSPFALADALVTATAGGVEASGDALAAVRHCWGDLLEATRAPEELDK